MKSELVELRCSGLDRFMACAASRVPPAVQIETSGEEAALGDAVHHCMSQGVLLGQRPDDDNLAAVAEGFAVEVDDLAPLVGAGWKCWQQIHGDYPFPKTEVALALIADGVTLTGHPDLFSATTGPEIRVLDYKSGYLESPCQHQLRGYGLLLLKEHPYAERVRAERIGLRAMSRDWWTWTRADLEQWWQRVVDQTRRPEVYTPGVEQCSFCPRAHECQGRTALLRSALSTVDAALAEFPMEPVNIINLHAFAILAGYAAGQVKDLIRAEVARQGGMIDCGDSRRLELRREPRRKVKAGPAFDEVINHSVGELEAADLDAATTYSLTKLLDGVRSHAPNRGKKKAADAFTQRLDDAGCLETTYIEKLELRRTPQQITSDTPTFGVPK
jgi:hypothetical protein